jgi:hypothetical protein
MAYLFNHTAPEDPTPPDIDDQVFPPAADAVYRTRHLRAKGSLTYLEFIKLVDTLWEAAHPDVPFQASGSNIDAVYPVVTYDLQLRKPHPSEPKVRFREEIRTPRDKDAIVIGGQRYQNLVNFSVTTEKNPELAEALIEAFEDFILEFTPVFKQLGLSEIVYARRLPDAEQSRRSEGIEIRTVSYLVTTEKVIQTSKKKLEEFLVYARMALSATSPPAASLPEDVQDVTLVDDNQSPA